MSQYDFSERCPLRIEDRRSVSQFKEHMIYGGGRGEECVLKQRGSPAPAALPGSAPVLFGGVEGFSWWQEEGGRADDVAGSAQLLLHDLLMAVRVFDDSCKNLRLRVSFTSVNLCHQISPREADLWSAPRGTILSTPPLDTKWTLIYDVGVNK